MMQSGHAMLKDIVIRLVQAGDNAVLAEIIRNSLLEFGAAKPGTVYYDETTDHLFQMFNQAEGSCYFVIIQNGQVCGGAGIYPTSALPEGTCEFVKLYLHNTVRGKGLGKLLMDRCEQAAKEMGYRNIYLETMPELKVAVPLYEKMGYNYLDAPLGNSGHTGCDIWMIKRIA